MEFNRITNELLKNKDVFKSLLTNLSEDEFLWAQSSDKWCLLEIVCHLYDEEREDFRARTKHVLETPEKPLPPIDPQAWVKERNYRKQNYSEILNMFLSEREKSIKWLCSLKEPKWENAYQHPKFGAMTAKMF